MDPQLCFLESNHREKLNVFRETNFLVKSFFMKWLLYSGVSKWKERFLFYDPKLEMFLLKWPLLFAIFLFLHIFKCIFQTSFNRHGFFLIQVIASDCFLSGTLRCCSRCCPPPTFTSPTQLTSAIPDSAWISSSPQISHRWAQYWAVPKFLTDGQQRAIPNVLLNPNCWWAMPGHAKYGCWSTSGPLCLVATFWSHKIFLAGKKLFQI